MQLTSAVLDPQTVRRIHDPDQGIRLLKVVPPVGPQRLLPTDVPWRWLDTFNGSVENNALGIQIFSLYLGHSVSDIEHLRQPWKWEHTLHSRLS